MNQYTQRTVPGFVDILGSAASNATVTVNGTNAGRQGGYFHSELALANTNAAAYSSVAIIASMLSGTNNVAVTNTGTAFLPKTPETFQHDPDGNLTSDGRWVYSWDAENRLTSMETTAAAASNGVPRQKLVFAYDHQSRRISKKVYAWASDLWTLSSELSFVYDGWNLLAEQSVVSGLSSVVRSYSWGLDLSGSMTGAGGIGGLLWMTSHQSPSTSHFYAFDGNGNVAALLNAATGQVSAEYEYSPFGETIRATGPAASENPFRFSTKRTDDTTGLIFYEYRVLNPVTGRWLSRDPIEEDGGVQLYLSCGNDPIAAIDPDGLEWHIVRNSDRNWAVAKADSAGDTFQALAFKIRLNYSERTKWLKKRGESGYATFVDQSDSAQQSCPYLVPNTVAVYTSRRPDFNVFNPQSYVWLEASNIFRDRVIDRSYLYASKGYKRVAEIDQDNLQWFSAIWKTDGIYAVLVAGHGDGLGLYQFGNTTDAVSAKQVLPLLPYKLATVWALFCGSAYRDFGHPPWSVLTSRTGGFRGFKGLAGKSSAYYDANEPEYIP